MTTLIVGDSILRHLPEHSNYKCLFYPGDYCEDLSEKLIAGAFDSYLDHCVLVIILIGTNDISLTLPHKVAHKVVATAQLFLARKPSITVAVTGILPRPGDHSLYNLPVKYTNQLLKPLCESSGIIYLACFRPLLRGGVPRQEYYTSSGLHPSAKGITALYRGFLSAIDRHSKGQLH